MSVNKVIIVGYAGKDVACHYLTNGDPVANASIATTEKWKDKDGEKHEKTEWHQVVFYKRQAEIAGEYLKKGSLVYVEGKLQTRKYQDKDGHDRYITEIIASRLDILNGKQDQRADSDSQAPEPQPKTDAAPKKGIFDSFEDDVPF